MPLGALNHFTVYTVDLARTRDFWRDVMGLTDGDRPPLGFPGHWMYSAGAPTVHLVGPREGDDGKPARRTQPTGQLDHIAFSATGLAEMRERLRRHDIPFREMVVPRDGQTQLFFHDPDGVGIELNFTASEAGS
ncbi:VOC family protein [Sediminicoccus rosea]|uniref:VOC family protein n=1 Tax=Sediminicoccus rosea TaxID=1225128 RepID=A0ABZ0PFF3_9PROT|nr:VOC family protein [Sediminicoccus rosea]WPB84332.1 VOC family protein [Sediminicoccus rosea]